MKLLRIVLFLVGFTPFIAWSDETSVASASELTDDLKAVRSVSVYLLSRTEKWSYGREELISNAQVIVTRKCGFNCAIALGGVLDHMKQSVRADCISGQEDVLIDIGSAGYIIYGYSDRAINYNGSCFFSGTGINEILKTAEFVFY